MMRRVSIVRLALIVLFSAAVGDFVAPAHSAPSPSSEPLATAHVRLWKTNLQNFLTLRVTLKSVGKHPITSELGNSGPGYLFNNYVDVPAGSAILQVFANAEKKLLRTMQIDLAAREFTTLLLSEPETQGNPLHITLIDDGQTTTGALSAQLTVRCLVRGLKETRVSVGDSFKADFVTDDGLLRLRGLKPALYPLHTAGIGPDGKPFEWNNEADLRPHRRQTLLIYPDSYGRIRPRLIEDGELPAASAKSDGQQ